jgi:hypothetical protein
MKFTAAQKRLITQQAVLQRKLAVIEAALATKR